MRIWIAAIVSVSISFNPVFATTTSHATTRFLPDKVTQQVFDRTSTPEQLVFISAFAGAKAGFLKTLRRDLAEAGEKNWPRLQVQNHEIHVNGRATGIWIDPKFPLRIAYQGNSWSYDDRAGFEQNYASLNKFLNHTNKTGMTNPWINAARAEMTKRDWSEVAGIAISIGLLVAGAAAVVATGGATAVVPIVATLGVGLVASANAGRQMGDHVYEFNEVKKAVRDIAKVSSVEVTCADKNSVITMKNRQGVQTRLEFVRKGEKLTVNYDDGVPGSRRSSSDVYLPFFPYAQMEQCKTADQAKNVERDIRDSIAEFKKSEESEKPAGEAATPAHTSQ